MSAPAALAIAKLMYPETKKSKADSKAIQTFLKMYKLIKFKINRVIFFFK